MQQPKQRAYRVVLQRLDSRNDNLGTDKIHGFCLELPTRKQPFVMFTDKEEYGYSRQIVTTEVQTCVLPQFSTLNSMYRLDIITEEFID